MSLCPDDGSFLEETAKKKGGITSMMFVYLLLVLAVVFLGFYYRNSFYPPKITSMQNASIPEAGTRFEATQCKSVKDSVTKLEWFIGADKNVTWEEANDFAAGLKECGGGWRMPSIAELTALYDPSQTAGIGYETLPLHTRRPAHMDAAFNAIGSGAFAWSSETQGIEASAYDLHRGKVMILAKTNNIYALRPFAVRAAEQ